MSQIADNASTMGVDAGKVWGGLRELEERRDRCQRALEPPPAKRVGQVTRAETGKIEAWWQIRMEVLLDLSGTHCGSESGAELTAVPGSPSANAPTRDRTCQSLVYEVPNDEVSEARRVSVGSGGIAADVPTVRPSHVESVRGAG